MDHRMRSLRLIHSVPPLPAPESTCLDAFDRELGYIFETLRRLGARPWEVEDLAQEIFVILHRNWPTLDTTRPLRPYLFGVAFRIICVHRRRRARETLYAALDVEDDALGPEGSLQAKESIELLMAALERVPLPRRAVIVMHELDGVPIADVARKLSVTRFGAYARLRKGRRELAAAVRWLLNEGVRK